jgi:hypothetical protein
MANSEQDHDLMTTVPLRDGTGAVIAEAIVDAEDFARLSRFRWSFRSGYVRRLVESRRTGSSLRLTESWPRSARSRKSSTRRPGTSCRSWSRG